MKKTIKLAAPLLSLVALVLTLSAAPIAYGAGSATLYLSPASGTYDVGETFSVAVRENSGSDQAVGVQANISYSTSKLSYVSVANSSAFNIAPPESNSNDGSLEFSRASITPRTGDQLVLTIKFKALAATSSTAVSLASGSDVTKYCPGCDPETTDFSLNPAKSGAAYKISSPASSPPPASPPPASPSPPPPPSSTPTKPASGGSTSPSPAPSPSSSPKTVSTSKITGLRASNVTAGSAQITWSTPVAGTTVVNYGTSKNNLDSTADIAGLTKSHSVTLGDAANGSGEVLAANTTYYYRASSLDAKGNSLGSAEGTFTTTASTAAGSTANNDLLMIVGGIAAGTFLLVLVLMILKHMHQHKLEQAELSRHFPDNYVNKPPQGPPTPPTPTVFTPTGSQQQ